MGHLEWTVTMLLGCVFAAILNATHCYVTTSYSTDGQELYRHVWGALKCFGHCRV